MLNIQKENPKDIHRIYEINKKAFEDETEAKIINALRDSDELVLSLVAIINGEAIGHIAFSKVKIKSEDTSYEAIGLGPMAILPEYQRKGYGTKLIEHSLKRLIDSGYKIVTVLGHPNFYSKFGFVASHNYGIRWEFDCPPEAFMIKTLKPNSLKGISGIVYYSSKFSEV